jgi:uncharacterized membrane protein YccC
MTSIDPRKAIFSLNTFAAAMLALYIGFSIGLPRPYWAMTTAYITAQPLSGAVRSKAVYRVIGTLLGAAAAVELVPNLVDSPELLSLCLALWVGFCLFVSLLDRTPRAYLFMLSGYTAAIVGFPSVSAPGAIFDVAVSRVEEICLGIICASLTHSLIFPRSVAAALTGRIDRLLSDASSRVRQALTIPGAANADRNRQRLAADATEVHLLSTHLPFDTAHIRPTTRAIRTLRDRVSVLLPLATAVEDRLEALGHPLEPRLQQLVAEINAFAAVAPGLEVSSLEADRLIQACQDLQPELDAHSGWPILLKASLLRRLAELIDALQDCRDLRAAVRDPTVRLPKRLDHLVRTRTRRPLHLDYGLALLSGAAAVLAIVLCCLVWIGGAWIEGAAAAAMVAIVCSFFATQDDPSLGIFGFLIYFTGALPLAALYLFAILPSIDGFPLLVLSLALVLLPLGYLIAHPALAGRMMAFFFGFAATVSLTESYSADFASFANVNLVQTVGFLVAIFITRLVRTVGADWMAWRILRFGWRDLARLAQTDAPLDPMVWTSQMLDRLGLLMPRLARAAADEELTATDALNDLRIGLNLVELQLARPVVGPDADRAIGGLLETLSGHFRGLASGRSVRASDELLRHLDLAIGEVTASPAKLEARASAIALTGLRRNLFPDATAYRSALEGVP